ncbi:MAG TPA: hypothetical protein VJT09_15990 [Pyrinomonadaceae bacterium]|nr:hypothetical protein [Pyrinomonadaceae bacterium]
MRTKLVSLLKVCLLLVICAGSQSHITAQDRKSNLPKENAPQNPLPKAAKVETSGGQKTENQAVRGRKRSEPLPKTELSAPTLGDLAPVEREDSTTPKTVDSTRQKTGNLNAAKTAAIYDVGIIPGANGCPPNSEAIEIYMDDEDDKNANSHGGWIGAIVHNRNTTFKFCRVDGANFPTPKDTAYAVLQLNTFCPPNSQPFSRYFDNEDYANENSYTGNIYPSVVRIFPNSSFGLPSSSRLFFCLFLPQPQSTMPSFPDFGIEYGVFASNDLPGILNSGWLHVDDEDVDNTNSYDSSYYSMIGAASKIISGSLNTDINIVKVRSGPTIPKLYSVSLNTSSVVGGSSCNNVVITVSLDAPALPGGQPVSLSSSNSNIAWIFAPKYFTIPAGQTSESASCFMGTKNVTTNRKVTITALVNGQAGYVDLDINK